MKKIIFSLIFITTIVIFSVIPNTVLADKDATVPGKIKREKKQEQLNLKKKIYGRGFITGIATATMPTSITVSGQSGTIAGKTVTVNITVQTILLRRFGAKAQLSEFQVNDEITIVGRWADQTQTVLHGKVIRDLSVQKRRGTFFGNIASLGNNSFVLNTLRRGLETVTLNSTTRLVNRKMQSLNFSDLAVEHKVRVKGLWDNRNKTITEVTQVKDFSLPPQGTPSASPTP